MKENGMNRRIMSESSRAKKLSIHKLLNPTFPILRDPQNNDIYDNNKKVKECLTTIKIELSDIFRTILDNNSIDHHFIDGRLQDLLNLLKMLPKLASMDSFNHSLTSNIKNLIISLEVLVKERNFIRQFEERILNEQNNNLQGSLLEHKKEFTFKMLTKKDMHGNSRLRAKGQRLPKVYTTILEKWYQENIRNPYLDDRSLQILMHQCSLERNQVKNWIANRRRKDRNSKISPVISSILE